MIARLFDIVITRQGLTILALGALVVSHIPKIGLETGPQQSDRHGFTPFLSESTRSVPDKISQLLQQSTDQ